MDMCLGHIHVAPPRQLAFIKASAGRSSRHGSLLQRTVPEMFEPLLVAPLASLLSVSLSPSPRRSDTYRVLRVKEDNRAVAIRGSQQKNGHEVSDGWRRGSGQVIGANEGAIRA